MRKFMRRIAQVACLALACPALMVAGVAHATTPQPAAIVPAVGENAVIVYSTWADKCQYLLWRSGSYVRAEVYLSKTATLQSCEGHLERYDSNHNPFYSGEHYVSTPGGTAYTDWYWDGAGYLAAACGMESYDNQLLSLGACTPQN